MQMKCVLAGQLGMGLHTLGCRPGWAAGCSGEGFLWWQGIADKLPQRPVQRPVQGAGPPGFKAAGRVGEISLVCRLTARSSNAAPAAMQASLAARVSLKRGSQSSGTQVQLLLHAADGGQLTPAPCSSTISIGVWSALSQVVHKCSCCNTQQMVGSSHQPHAAVPDQLVSGRLQHFSRCCPQPTPAKCQPMMTQALLPCTTCLGGGESATLSQRTRSLACCRHLVLAVMHKPSGKWGALGLSRRAQLMDKPAEHSTLSSLVQEFRQAYQRWWHEVLKLRVGLPAPHDATSGEMVGLQ